MSQIWKFFNFGIIKVDWNYFFANTFKEHQILWELLIFFLIAFFAHMVFYFFNNRKYIPPEMREIDKMKSDLIEKRLKKLFVNLGYKVKNSGAHQGKESGADFLLEKDGEKIAVHVKCTKRYLIGETAVKEVMEGKKMFSCNAAQVITNRMFSEGAKKLAEENNVWLYDREGLMNILNLEKIIIEKTQKQGKL